MDRFEHKLEYLIHTGKWKKILKLLKSPISRLFPDKVVWVILMGAEDGLKEFVKESIKSKRLMSYFKLDDFEYLFKTCYYYKWGEICEKIIEIVIDNFTPESIYNTAPSLSNAIRNTNLDINVKYIKNSDEMCSICLDNNPTVETNCGHQFHKKCLEDWKEISETCPMCRSRGMFFGKQTNVFYN